MGVWVQAKATWKVSHEAAEEILSREVENKVRVVDDRKVHYQKESDIVLIIKVDEKEDVHVLRGFEPDDYQITSISNIKFNKYLT